MEQLKIIDTLETYHLLEDIIGVKLPTPPATPGGNQRSVDRMTAASLCRYLLGGIILEGVHWLEGPVDGSSSGAAFHVTHQRRGVSTAWSDRVSVTDV